MFLMFDQNTGFGKAQNILKGRDSPKIGRGIRDFFLLPVCTVSVGNTF